MSTYVIERIIALIGALLVGTFALIVLRAEWKRVGLDDHVSKIMMALLTIGCIIVLGVALSFWGRFEGVAR